MDQFTFAEQATDWRSNNNIAETIFAQLSREDHPIPAGSWSAPHRGTLGPRSAVYPLSGP
jgi:cysteine synthase A